MSELRFAKSYVFDTETGWIMDPPKKKKSLTWRKKMLPVLSDFYLS